ncbi:MAG: primosomal protein N', partial [Ruthenibacterium sp.]
SELRMRRLRRYPPFADLFTLTVSGSEESAVLRACVSLRDELRRAMEGDEALRKTQAEVLGPAPAPVLRVKGRFRYRILLVGKNDKATRNVIAYFLKEFARCRDSRGMNLFASCNALE